MDEVFLQSQQMHLGDGDLRGTQFQKRMKMGKWCTYLKSQNRGFMKEVMTVLTVVSISPTMKLLSKTMQANIEHRSRRLECFFE